MPTTEHKHEYDYSPGVKGIRFQANNEMIRNHQLKSLTMAEAIREEVSATIIYWSQQPRPN